MCRILVTNLLIFNRRQLCRRDQGQQRLLCFTRYHNALLYSKFDIIKWKRLVLVYIFIINKSNAWHAKHSLSVWVEMELRSIRSFVVNSQPMNYVCTCDNMFSIGCNCGNGSITSKHCSGKKNKRWKEFDKRSRRLRSIEQWYQQQQQVQIFTSGKMMMVLNFSIEHWTFQCFVLCFSFFFFFYFVIQICFIPFALVFLRNFDSAHRNNFTLSEIYELIWLDFAKFQNISQNRSCWSNGGSSFVKQST